jgi:hypothetical protein
MLEICFTLIEIHFIIHINANFHTTNILLSKTAVSDTDMLIGYTRISKSDGSQNLDLQKDALMQVGVFYVPLDKNIW